MNKIHGNFDDLIVSIYPCDGGQPGCSHFLTTVNTGLNISIYRSLFVLARLQNFQELKEF